MLIFLSLVLIIPGFVLGVGLGDESSVGFSLSLGLVIVGWFLVIVHYEEKPKAIDVYRNKTSLQITYRDSIPVDSVVVFKDGLQWRGQIEKD